MSKQRTSPDARCERAYEVRETEQTAIEPIESGRYKTFISSYGSAKEQESDYTPKEGDECHSCHNANTVTLQATDVVPTARAVCTSTIRTRIIAGSVHPLVMAAARTVRTAGTNMAPEVNVNFVGQQDRGIALIHLTECMRDEIPSTKYVPVPGGSIGDSATPGI